MRALLAAISLAICGTFAACGSDDDGDGGGGGEGGGGAEFVREAAQDLSAEDKRDFTDAVLKLKRMPAPFEGYEDFSYYDAFVKWHKDAFNCDTQTAHMGPNFLPWHRHFLVLFEEALSKAAGKPVAIPYWDWTDPASTNAVFNDDFLGGDVEGWRNEIGQKCENGLIAPLSGPGVTRHELHNGVHLWVGGLVGERQGTMDLNTSLNDPVFWLHHANIDRLWQAWIEANGEVYEPVSGWPRPDQNLNQPMIPYKDFGQRVTPKSVLDISKLGHEYAELPEASPAKGRNASASAGPPSLGSSCAPPA